MAKSGTKQEGSGTMPGKPFRSSLEPHFDEIALRRAQRETWAGIAAELEKAHGLKVHFSAVQKFFGRHLARQSQPLGFAPLPTAAAATTAPVVRAPSSTIQPPPKMHPPDPKPPIQPAPKKPSAPKQPKSKLSPGTKAFIRQMAENLNTHDPTTPKGRLKKP